jgi:VWFA-related protein
MLSRRRFLYSAAAFPAATAFGWQDEPRFSTGVSVVNVLAVVRNRDGKIVADLDVDDFELLEDGQPQPIRYFSRQTDLPLIIGLLIDTSGSVRNVIDDEVKAARQFLRQVIRPAEDQAFVIQFASEIELVQDLTPSVPRLEQSLEDLDPGGNRFLPFFFQLPGQTRLPGRSRFPIPLPNPQPGRLPPQQPDPRTTSRRSRSGTSLHDAVFLGADEVMRPQSGRKAMIVISDGLDGGSRVTLSTAIEMAQRADTLVYTIRFSGSNPGRNSDEGVAVLERLAEETGGAYFDATENRRLDRVFDSIEEELRNQYNLGFTPDALTPGYRRIRVNVKRPGMTVRARDGYYSGR